jgi:hypothetical protein
MRKPHNDTAAPMMARGLSGATTPPVAKARADETEPLLVSPARARAMLGYGTTKFYELLNSGAIASFKDGAARRVVASSLREYVARMLVEAGATPAERPARVPPRPKRRAASGAATERAIAPDEPRRRKRKSTPTMPGVSDTRGG